MKDKDTVIEYAISPTEMYNVDKMTSEFNNLVNMTPTELRDWLEQEESLTSGWGGNSGETIGHER